MNERLRWIRNNLKVQNIQGMIISNPTNIKYLTNIEAEGILLLTLKENIYITDDRYISYVKKILTIDDEIIITNVRDIGLIDYENYFMFCEKRNIFICNESGQRVGSGSQVQKPSLACFFHPFRGIVIAVENNTLMFPDGLLN